MKVSFTGKLIMAAASAMVSASVCAADITGAGATFPYPIYAKWAESYKSVTGSKLNYQAIGSGGGIKQIKAKTVDFGASDMPLKASELQAAGLVQFPAILGGVVPIVNLPGVKAGQLKMSGDVLHEKGIVMIEQPMPKEQLDDIAWVTQQSPLPIFADESIQRLKDVAGLKGAFTGINIKLMKCTGMREAWKMVTLARALDMKVMVGCMTETSCAITAASQFSPAVDFADLDGSLLIANDRFKGMEVVKGKITLPDLPGIGVVKL